MSLFLFTTCTTLRYNLIMLVIRKLLWNERNTTHVARHGIIPEEVEEICRQEPVVQRGTKRIDL